jgi:manganese transport protein
MRSSWQRRLPTRVLVWGLFVVISAANSWLIVQLLR